jgi:hypothetical protein
MNVILNNIMCFIHILVELNRWLSRRYNCHLAWWHYMLIQRFSADTPRHYKFKCISTYLNITWQRAITSVIFYSAVFSHLIGTSCCFFVELSLPHFYIYLCLEELHLLGYNAVQSGESQRTFRRNISPPSSRFKSKPRKKSAWSRRQKEFC